MSRFQGLTLLTGLLGLVFFAGTLLCQEPRLREGTQADESQAKKEDVPPQSGVLAGTGTGGYGNNQAAAVWGSKDGMADGAGAPVSASVNRISSEEYLVKVVNNSPDIYRMNLQLVQINGVGRQIKIDNFTLSLKGKESAERRFRAAPDSLNASVALKNWKKTARKKTPEELKNEMAEQKKKMVELEKEFKSATPAKPVTSSETATGRTRARSIGAPE